MDLPEPPAAPLRPARAPAAGLKLMLLIAFVLGLAAVYGQWQHLRRPIVDTARITAASAVSSSPSPHQP
ncbi:MAG TPA: hypothetical protein VGI85_16310 [Chthoniobacterales bacterium]|jgi:hypothetical protein